MSLCMMLQTVMGFSLPRELGGCFMFLDMNFLNGGFKKWCEDGYATSDIIEKVKKDTFIPKFREELVKSFEDIERNLNEKSFEIIDARGSDRFNGTGPEPRPGTLS